MGTTEVEVIDDEYQEDYIQYEKKPHMVTIHQPHQSKMHYKVEYFDSKPQKPAKYSVPFVRNPTTFAPPKASSSMAPGGQIDHINKRLDRIEAKIDMLLSFLVGESAQSNPTLHETDPFGFQPPENPIEVIEEQLMEQEDDADDEFYQFSKVNSDEEMAELTKKLDHDGYLESLLDHIRSQENEELCSLRDLFTEKYLNQHSFGWTPDKKDIQSNPLYARVYKPVKAQMFTEDEIAGHAKREMTDVATGPAKKAVSIKRKQH